MLILTLVLIAGTSVLLGVLSITSTDQRTALQERRALADARDSLIIYALLATSSDGDLRPGALPCPDLSEPGDPDYGRADSLECINSNAQVMLARLPNRTLGLERGEQDLWLAIDLALHNEPDNTINPHGGLSGGLRINDGGGYAAVLLAPGPPLEGQRVDGHSADPEDYLEANNAIADRDFVDCRDRSDCNDRAVGLGLDQLFAPVQVRVLAAVEGALEDFYSNHGHLPRPASLNSSEGTCNPDIDRGTLPIGEPPDAPDTCQNHEYLDLAKLPDWVVEHQWVAGADTALVIFHVAPDCTVEGSGDCSDGPLTIDDGNGLGALIAGAGRELDGQDRDRTDAELSDYLEPPNHNAGSAYTDDGVRDGVRNDVFRGIQLP